MENGSRTLRAEHYGETVAELAEDPIIQDEEDPMDGERTVRTGKGGKDRAGVVLYDTVASELLGYAHLIPGDYRGDATWRDALACARERTSVQRLDWLIEAGRVHRALATRDLMDRIVEAEADGVPLCEVRFEVRDADERELADA